MKAKFSPAIINQLRDRVIRFNEALPDISREASLIKLQTLKGLYKRWYGGKDPHSHALHKIDEHLEALTKAQEPFSEGEHPRDGTGRFAGGQRGHFRDVATRAQHQALADNNAGYDASQTQVIPETRYSTLMPLGLATGITAYGAHTGATATIKGSALDRLQHRVAGVGGKHVGATLGHAVATPIAGAASVTRGAIGRINRKLHTTYRRPGPEVAGKIRRAIVERATKLGEKGATKVSEAQVAAVTLPSITARKLTTKVFGTGRVARAASRVHGGLVGGALAGILVAPHVYHAGQRIGSYLDAAFPRHVRKQLEGLIDAPEVLAKQQELLEDDLAKANIGAALRGVATAARGFGGRAARLASRLRPRALPAVAAPAAPTSIGGAAAHSTFGHFGAKPEAQGGQFAVRRNRIGRIGAAATPTASLGIFGAGTGAIAGAAGVGTHDYLFADKHPRDPKGRFATKTRSAKLGAIVGGAVGTGVGLAVGIAAARHGHTNLLRAALERLGTAAPAMHAATAEEARNVHARAFFDHKPNRRLMSDNAFAPDEAITHGKIQTSLEAHAGDAWAKVEGQALRAGPVKWYEHQLGQAFDKATFPQLSGIVDSAGEKTPLLDKAGKVITGGDIRGLRNRIDPEHLNTGQRKLWDDFVARHDAEVGKLQGVYDARKLATANLQSEINDLVAEGKKLDDDLGSMARDAMEMEHGGPKLADVKAFAKRRLGHDIKARGVTDALNELKVAINEWKPAAEARNEEIQEHLPHMRTAIDAARKATAQDVTDSERMAIVNPFARGREPKFLEPMPNYDTAKKAAETAGSRNFLQAGNIHAAEAKDHLNLLIAADQAALEARIPRHGVLRRAFTHVAPVMSAWFHQAAADITAVNRANKASMTDTQKSIFAWVNMDKTPTEAMAAITKLARGAAGQAGRVKAFTLANWQPITTITGLAGAVGAVDIAGPKGKRITVNPSKWKRAVGLKVVHDRPAGKPNEALIGLSYRDKDNQEKFLHGVHITNEKGAHTEIPFGTEVNAYRNQMRSGGGGGGGGGNSQSRADPLPLDANAQAEVNAALKTAEQHIESVGPADATFRQRKVGVGSGQAEAEKVMAGYRTAHINFLDKNLKPAQSAGNQLHYWKSIDALFRGSPMQLLTNSQRAALIIGDRTRRGVFANPSGVFQGNDKSLMTNQLVRQIGAHSPTEEGHYRQMKRALWVAAEHLALPAADRTRLDETLNKAYENAGKPRPAGNAAGSFSGTAGSRAAVTAVEDEVLREFPNNVRTDDYVDEDAKLREAAAATYRRYVGIHRNTGSEAEVHDRALQETIASLRILVQLHKVASEDGLRKFLSYATPEVPRRPKMPRIGGAGAMPDVNPVPSTSGRPPRIAGSSTAPTRNIATRLDAGHQLSQAGSYGLSQAAWKGVDALSAKFIPGHGIASKAARFALPAAASYVGAVHAGPSLGAKAGRVLGDKTVTSSNAPRSEDEAGVRSLGGTGTQLGTEWALHTARGKALTSASGKAIGRVAGKAVGATGRRIAGAAGDVAGRAAGVVGNAAGRVAGVAGRGIAGGISSAAGKIGGSAARAATTGAFERIGAKVGGWIGRAGGGAAGSVLEPGGGTVAGGIGGAVAGTAIGAGAGWLADEGIGMLYRHLGHYGQHIPDMAAQSLGHKGQRGGARA